MVPRIAPTFMAVTLAAGLLLIPGANPAQAAGAVSVTPGSARATITIATLADPLVTYYRVDAGPVIENGLGIFQYEWTLWVPAEGQANLVAPMTGLQNGRLYQFDVKAMSTEGEQVVGTRAFARPLGPPTAPKAASLKFYPGGVNAVSWTRVTSTTAAPVTGYRVYLGTKLVRTVSASTTSVKFTGARVGRTYQYTVRAINSLNVGAPRNTLKLVHRIPARPAKASLGFASAGRNVVTWTKVPSTTAVKVTGYRVYAGSKLLKSVNASTSRVTLYGAVKGRTYQYKVITVSTHGFSSARFTPKKVRTIR
jgi:hypothetical protein